MIPTFVITLREGVEASLIVGIIAAFLVKEGRRDALRQMWIGVGIAIVLCTAVGVGLNLIGEELPQQQQEGLETIVGVIAVAMITYMIIWMTRHSRGIKAELEGEAASALATGSTMALVAMAFLAVLREGFETSVFLLAAFQDSTDTTAAGAGASSACVAALLIGVGLYRGGVRINLSRFFRITGLVLVFVAAGLLATAAHTAHEAGWINSFQSQAVDLTWLVQPGTISGSLLTGMLGLQPRSPTQVEVVVYLAYAIPMVLFVLWPRRCGCGAAASAGQPAAPPSPRPDGRRGREPALAPPPAEVRRGRRGRARARRRRLPGRPGDRRGRAPKAPAPSTSTAPTRRGSTPPPRTASTSPPSTSSTKTRRRCASCCASWTQAAREMTSGEMIGDVNDVALAPPDDTGETVGLLPSTPHRHLRLRPGPVREAGARPRRPSGRRR